MTDSREALLGRFRAGLLERIGRLQAALQDFGATSNRTALEKDALGELHTLKGEARMLGLLALANLAHTVESEFALNQDEDPTPFKQRLTMALDAMHASLEEDIDERSADALLHAALAELDASPERRVPSDANLLSNPSAPTNGASIRPARDETPNAEANVRVLPMPTGETAPERRAEAGAESVRRAQRFTQVEVTTVDALCDRIAELSSAFGQLHAKTSARARRHGELKAEDAALLEHFAKCRTLLDDSTASAWALRLVSVEPVLRELARHARTLAMRVGKLVDVKVNTGGAQLERDVLDQLWEPLLHLVQNAVDHGLEVASDRRAKTELGTIVLSAESQGTNVILRVEDDGRGIDANTVRKSAVTRGLLSSQTAANTSDAEIVQLLFDHGFSTRETITDISGRGVGLDVVRQKVESLGGHVEINTEIGRGTRFSLHVPFAMTRERLLIVEVLDTLYALPSRVVRGVHEINTDDPYATSQVLTYESEPLPLRSLSRALGLSNPHPENVALILEIAGRRYGLGVPKVLGERELIRRPAEPLLAGAGVIGASAVLEDGRLVLLLDLGYLHSALRRRHTTTSSTQPVVRQRRQRVLVVDDSPVVRELVSEVLASAGLEVENCHDGAQALTALEKSLPDLVLSDVEMPHMSGFELLTEIRHRSQRIPVIMLTTRGSVEDRRRAASLGANAYLVKADFRGDTLLEVVRRFVHVSA
jgi:chemotaxis protein histidine kinase CheA